MHLGAVVACIEILTIVSQVTDAVDIAYHAALHLLAIHRVNVDSTILVIYRGIDVLAVGSHSHRRLRTVEFSYELRHSCIGCYRTLSHICRD